MYVYISYCHFKHAYLHANIIHYVIQQRNRAIKLKFSFGFSVLEFDFETASVYISMLLILME